ncbi:MAG: hypothetical protein ACI9DJ_001517, partial [Algoriphagus sp.]
MKIRNSLLPYFVFALCLSSSIQAQQINDDFIEGEIYIKVKASLTGRSLNRASENVNAQRE